MEITRVKLEFTTKKIFNLLVLMALLICIPVDKSYAHKITVFAWVEDGVIYSESRFASGKNAIKCAITVMDEKGLVIQQGVTDAEGKYSFKIPENIDSGLLIELVAGTGHKATWTIPEDELLTVASPEDLKAAMKEKQNLEKSPSPFKILLGIGIIFLLALGIKLFKKKGRA
jgi:nickel transport protein